VSRGVVRRLLAEEGTVLPLDTDDIAADAKNRSTIARVLQLPPQDPRVSLWFHLHRQFASAVHYHEPGPSSTEVRTAFDELGGLLFGRIGPYFATQTELDALLSIEHPTPEDVDRLQRNLLRPSQRRYFFSRLSHPGWATPLANAGVFGNPPERVVDPESGSWSTRAWPEGEYLVRVAGEASETVVQVLRELPEDLQNPAVWKLVAEAGCAVPPNLARRLVPLLTKALTHTPAIIFPQVVTRLIAHLATAGQKEAFQLAEYLLFVPDAPPETEDHRILLTFRTQWMLPRLESHALEGFFETSLPALEEFHPERTLRLLLGKMNRIQHVAEMLDMGGSWGLWHDAFEETADGEKVPAQLASATAGVAERFASSNTEAAKATNSLLKEHSGWIFRRIRYRILTAAGAHLQEELDTVIGSQEAIEPEMPAREIAALLRLQYSNASSGARRLFRYALLRGPDVDTLQYYVTSRADADTCDEDLDEARKRWQRNRLIWFRGVIPDELRDIAEDVGVYGVIPTHEQQELAEVGTYSGGFSWGGEPTPATTQELANQTPQAVFELLRDWKPGEDSSSGTLRGLNLTVEDYAAISPHEALAVGELAIQHELRLESVDAIIRGLGRAAESGEFAHWAGLIAFVSRLVDKACDRGVQRGERDSIAWREIVDAAVNVLDAGCSKDRIPPELQEDVWAAVTQVTRCPLPGTEFSREPLQSIDGVLMAALNDTAGKVARVIVSAALWTYRVIERTEQRGEEGTVGTKEVLRSKLVPLLDDVMELDGRAGIAARAMIGHFIPQLHLLVPEWLATHVELLFAGGAEDPVGRPAWGAYLIRSPVYESVFHTLRPWYKKAADVAGMNSDREFGDRDRLSPTKSLALHVLVGFLRGYISLGDSDRLIETVFSNVPTKERGRAYWSIFRGLSDSNEAPSREYLDRIVQFWEWRLSELVRVGGNEAVEEAIGLGWLFRTPHLPDEAVIRLGVRTAQLAKGDIEVQTDWARLGELIRTDVDLVFEIAEAVVHAQLRARYAHVPVDDVKPILRRALRSGRPHTQERVRTLIHRLGEHGFLEFGDLLDDDGPSNEA
jgi:hypothetical protein